MENKRLKELDILRAFAFILVVEQHSMGGFINIVGITTVDSKIFTIFYVLAKPAVSIFLCISGIALFYAYYENFNLKKYYIKRISNIFIPYIIWSIIYLIINNDIDSLFIKLLSGSGCYHLWYMGMNIRLLIYFPIILYFFKKIRQSSLKFKSVTFILLIISYYYISKYQTIISSNLINFVFTNPTKYEKRLINISPLFWYLYFIIGVYISFNYKKFKDNILKYKTIIITCYMILLMYSYLNLVKVIKFNRILSLSYYIFSFLALYILAVKLSTKVKIYNFFNFINKYSFGSYLAHILVINKVSNILKLYFNINNILVYGFILWIGSSIITPLIIKIISYIPYTKFVTGVKSVSYISYIKSITGVRNIDT